MINEPKRRYILLEVALFGEHSSPDKVREEVDEALRRLWPDQEFVDDIQVDVVEHSGQSESPCHPRDEGAKRKKVSG